MSTMSSRNIYLLPTVMQSLRPIDIDKIVEFLGTHDKVFINQTAKESLFKERNIASSPMNKLFYSYVDERAWDIFSAIHLKAIPATALSESLTYRHITTDITQMGDVVEKLKRSISINDNLRGKLIANTTQYVQTDGVYYQLKDQDRFHSDVVRDCLVRSYYRSANSTYWMRNSVTITAAKTYALLLGNNIARWFGLDQATQDYVTIVFCAYFLGKCFPDNSAEGFLISNCKAIYVRDREAILHVLDNLNKVIDKRIPTTLEDCFAAINSLGINRLKLGRSTLYSKLRTIADELPATTIALEYPPYFVWAMINAISGAKNQLNIFITRQHLTKDIQQAIGELIQSPAPLY